MAPTRGTLIHIQLHLQHEDSQQYLLLYPTIVQRRSNRDSPILILLVYSIKQYNSNEQRTTSQKDDLSGAHQRRQIKIALKITIEVQEQNKS